MNRMHCCRCQCLHGCRGTGRALPPETAPAPGSAPAPAPRLQGNRPHLELLGVELSVPHSPHQPRGVELAFIQPSLTRFIGATDQTPDTALNKPAQEGNLAEEIPSKQTLQQIFLELPAKVRRLLPIRVIAGTKLSIIIPNKTRQGLPRTHMRGRSHRTNFLQKWSGIIEYSQTHFLQHSRSEWGLSGRAWFHPDH